MNETTHERAGLPAAAGSEHEAILLLLTCYDVWSATSSARAASDREPEET